MFTRFGIDFDIADQCKFVLDLMEHVREQRDITAGPAFSERKPDNKISKYVNSSSERGKIALFTKVINATNKGPIVLWSLSNTVTCNPITGKQSYVFFRI